VTNLPKGIVIIQRSILLQILILLTIRTYVLFAQDSTFQLTEAYHLPSIDNAIPHNLHTYDLDQDGYPEIIADYIVNDSSLQIAVFKSDRLAGLTEMQSGRVNDLFFCDFNCDGDIDIMTESVDQQHLYGYYGPSYDLGLSEAYYLQDRIRAGGDRLLDYGDTTPIIVTRSFNYLGNQQENNRIVQRCGSIWQGTWQHGRPEKQANINLTQSFQMYHNSDSETNYFSAGRTGISENDETEIVYFDLFTSYNADFNQPDSVILCQLPAREEGELDARKRFGFFNGSIVEDIDSDGRLDWVQAHWERPTDSTMFIHLPVYDPSDLSFQREYVEEVSDIFIHEMFIPAPILETTIVDIDEDGILEILLAIQGRPLRIIDSRTMDLITSSNFILPDETSRMFVTGVFDRSGRVRIAREVDNEIVVYNLPEEWTMPNSAPTDKIKYPDKFVIKPAYPNPFNSTTTIAYNLPMSGEVRLSIHDIHGREITVLQNEAGQMGYQTVLWNAVNQPSGLYLCRLESNGKVSTAKLMLMK
jgi:hypothetical protein